MRRVQEEVGDLFVTEAAVTVKLLPSKKSASKPIRWFIDGEVTNSKKAARDIFSLVARVQGKTRVVRRLTLMTDRGSYADLSETGLIEAVEEAGFTPLN